MNDFFSSKKFIIISAVLALCVVGVLGYTFLPFGGGISPESALPKDSQFVMAIDHSDRDQVKNMKKLLAMLPDFGVSNPIEDQVFNVEDLKKNGLDYKEDILPIVEGDFKMALAIDFSKYGKEEGFVFSVYTDENSKMKNFLDKTKESGKFFYENDGDVFVIAYTQAEVDSALKTLKEGNGFSSNESFKNASKNSKGNLGYVYFEMGDSMKEFIANGGQGKNLEGLSSQLEVTKTIYAELVAKEDGFGFEGLGNLISDKELVAKSMPYFGKKLSVFEKVPLENPILYMEMPSIGQYIGSFVAGFRGGLDENGVTDVQKDYDDFLTLVSGFGGISVDEAKGIFESTFSFGLGDSGEKYPTIALYFDVDAKYSNAAKKFVGSIDAYSAAIIKEFEGILGVKDVLKKSAVVVNGGGMYKLYVDFNNVPAELLATFNVIPGLDAKKMKIELYYGLTGDNVLTFALYPEFDKAYGEKTISHDKDVSAAIDGVGKSAFYAFFLSPEKLINFIDTNYYKIAKDNGFIGDYDKDYVLVKNTMQTLKYFVSAYSMPESDQASFNGFLKFQEIEKDKALEKVKEGK